MQIGMHFEDGWIQTYVIDSGETIEKEPKPMQGSWEDCVEEQFLRNPDKIRVGVVMKHMTTTVADEAERLRVRLGISADQLKLYTKEETVLGLVRCQENQLDRGKTVLFEYVRNGFTGYEVEKAAGTISVKKYEFTDDISDARSDVEKDQAFKTILAKALAKGVTATVYLCGEEFERQWFRESTQVLCSGRRVFMGNNLYACGAAYLVGNTSVAGEQEEAVIRTENMAAYQIGITLHHHGKDVFYPVIKSGRPWFESNGEITVIVSGISALTLEVRDHKNCKAASIIFPLTGMMKKNDIIYKLKIQGDYLTESQCRIKISDQGFGAIRPSTYQVWQQIICLERGEVHE